MNSKEINNKIRSSKEINNIIINKIINTKMSIKEIKNILSDFGISMADSGMEKLIIYMERILELNESINLTAITDRKEFVIRHYADSLTLVNTPEYDAAKSIIDIGTGGGFPGVPLAVYSPNKSFVLLDSLEKRLKIIDTLCEELSIENVETLHERAEDAGKNEEYREKFDLCISRAVANLSVLSEYCLPFVKAGGFFVAYKSSNLKEELEESKKAISILGGEIIDVRETETSQTLVVIKKIKATPKKYPRKAGDPRRKPLK